MKQLTTLKDCIECKDCCYYHRHYLGLSTILEKNARFTKKEKEKLVDKGKFYQAKCERKKSLNYFFCDFKDGDLCQLKEKRPFGCKLYPFNVMKNREGKPVVGLDRDCLGIKNKTEKQIKDYVKYLKPLLKKTIKSKPYYVEEFQEELEVIDCLFP